MAQTTPIEQTIVRITDEGMVKGEIIITLDRVDVYATTPEEIDPTKKEDLFQSLRTLQQALASGAITLPAEGITLFFNLRMG